MFNALLLQRLILHVTLERVDFGYRVRYGRSGQKVDSPPFMFPLQIPALDEQIERLGGACDIAEAGDVHRGLEGEILELVGLVDEQRIHAQIREVHPSILFPGSREKGLITGFHPLPLLFKLLDCRPASSSLF